MTLFAYRKGSTLLHKLPALLKIIFLAAFNIFIFWEADSFLIWRLSAGSLVCLVFFILAKCGPKTLKSLFYVLLLGILVTLFNLSKAGLIYGALYTARFLLAALLAQIVFETTSPLEIKEAVPIAALSLAINFIPEIFSEWNKIHLAARARSAKSGRGFFYSCARAVFFTPLLELEALFSNMLDRAEKKRRALLNRS